MSRIAFGGEDKVQSVFPIGVNIHFQDCVSIRGRLEVIMRVLTLLLILLFMPSSWASSADKKLVQLEKRLVQSEEIMAEMISANEKFSEALQNTDPASRPAMCHVLSELGKTVRTDMKKLNNNVLYLEKKNNYALLTQGQIDRLQKQKGFISDFVFVNCDN